MKLLCISQIHSPRRFDIRVLQAVVGHRREGVGAAQLDDGLDSLVGLSNNSCPGAAAHSGAGTVTSVVSASELIEILVVALFGGRVVCGV